MKKIKSALISLSDKSKLKPLLKELKKNKIKIISSGGTFKTIKKLKFPSIKVSDFTKFDEILDGRVKTLHPKIHGGILNKRNNKTHLKELKKNNIENIDLVIVNFYPFEKTIEQTSNHNKIIENIDIGGPAMVRAAAKNYNDVAVITSPDQYAELIDQLKKNKGCTTSEYREKMSRIAFGETAYYDSVVANYFNGIKNISFPKRKIWHTNLVENLRYGENPHQISALYSKNINNKINQIHGKTLSYNNYNDIFTALTITKSLPKNAGTVIVKHSNPCGVSALKNDLESYKSALNCDPISAFGGIISCNYKITQKIAFEMSKIFLEVIVAKGFDKNALKILRLKKNLRLIDSSNLRFKELFKFNSMDSFTLIQSEDNKSFSKKCKSKGINFIQLVSPTTSKIRLKKIVKDSHDMIYYISMLSTTGGKLKVSPKKILENYFKIKNQNKSKNVVIGFGITEKTIKSLKKADGLVVGSAICKEISKSIKNRQNAVTNVTNVVRRLKNKIK